MISESGKLQSVDTIISDTKAIQRYKELVENRHAPEGTGDRPIYLYWIEF